VAVSTSNRRGPMSRRAIVPLIAPPPPPTSPGITYSETAVTINWAAPVGFGSVQDVPTEELLPSTLIGVVVPTLAYNVYEPPPKAADPVETGVAAAVVPPPAASTVTVASGDDGRPAARKLTDSPVPNPIFVDNRVSWGDERCYEVRTVELMGGLSIESAVATPVCTVLVDTFPPQAPMGLTAVPSQGIINLIWQPNDEKDLQGYLVLRGTDPDKLERLTSSPIPDTTFKDTVPAGGRYLYVVKAIDLAGNESAASNRVEETSR
jgi:hypothetical protein